MHLKAIVFLGVYIMRYVCFERNCVKKEDKQICDIKIPLIDIMESSGSFLLIFYSDNIVRSIFFSMAVYVQKLE